MIPDITLKKIQRHVNMKKITICCGIIGLCGVLFLILSVVSFIYIPVLTRRYVFNGLSLTDKHSEAHSNFVSNITILYEYIPQGAPKLQKVK